MSTAGSTWFTGPPDDPYRYRVLDPEGIAGGEALVFRAWDEAGRAVALKQVTSATPRQRERLLEQAESLDALHHPNVVEQVETFVGPGLFNGPSPSAEDFDLIYLVSAWVEGTTLASLGAAPSPSRALELLADIAAGVHHLHAHGVVHRDLHPGNVVVAADRAVVIDLAYVRAATAPARSVVFGAPGFVPPERLDDPGSADEGADRWQVAMLAVQLLLGRPRRREPLAQLRDELTAALSEAVPDPAASGHEIVRMLASDPELRPSIPLDQWVAYIRSAGVGRAQPAASPPQPTRRRPRRPSAPAVVLGLLAAATVATAAALGSQSTRPTNRPSTTPRFAATPSTACLIAIGESDRRIALPAARYAAITELGRGVEACPTAIVDAWGSMAVQTFDSSSPVGALVSSGPGHSFALTQAQWSSYRTIGGKDGSHAAEIAGPILSITTTPGSDVLRTAKGELVGDAPTAPHIFRASNGRPA